MIALDTNVLVALLVSSSELHERVTRAMSDLDDDLCTTPTNIGECLRLLTHPKVFQNPLKIGIATEKLSDLLAHFDIRILDEEIDWWRNLEQLENELPDLKGNEVFDARIALCLKDHHVKKIFTYDSDFKKYSFLRVHRAG